MLVLNRTGCSGTHPMTCTHQHADCKQVLPICAVGPIAPSQGADGSVFMAVSGDSSIRRLAPMPYDQQARSLAASDEYTEALSMAALMPSVQVSVAS